MTKKFITLTVVLCALSLSAATAQDVTKGNKKELPVLSLDEFQDGIHHWNLEHAERNYPRLKPEQVREIADNLLAYQNEDGGWPKNLDWLGVLNADSVKQALTPRYRESTVDNRNTYPQIDYLAQVYTLTGESKYRKGAEKGIEYILNTQNASGGWRGWDVDAITFNDDVTTGAMALMMKVRDHEAPYAWVDKKTAATAGKSYDRALDVTLRCQIVVDGVKTAWCQQHDHTTLAPCKARTYELPCITPSESADVVLFLMSLPNPDQRIIDAVKSAVAWFKKAQLSGIRIEKVSVPESEITNHEYPYNLIVVEDPAAPPIWARFYEIDNKVIPFMCNRDGIKVYKLSDVLPERRMGYSWYGNWPEKVFKAYPEWLQRVEKK